jgi:hypothetical protein
LLQAVSAGWRSEVFLWVKLTGINRKELPFPYKFPCLYKLYKLYKLFNYFYPSVCNSEISCTFAASKFKEKSMETTVNNESLNAMQVHFLQSLRFVKTAEMFQELRQIISDYYFKKMEASTDNWWEENNMSNEKLEEMFLHSHHRVSSK